MRFCVLLVVTAFAVFVVGCGEETAVEKAEEEAGVEEIVEEETNYSAPVQAPPRDEAEAKADEAKRKAAEQGAKATPKGEAVQDFDPITELLACQSSEVGVELSPQEADALGTEMMQAISSGSSPNFQSFLAERGYTCGGRAEKILAMTPQERMQMPSDEKIELSQERQRMEAEERSKMRQE